MSETHFPEGIKIGPDTEESSADDRLPIYDFDEWAAEHEAFTLDAGEQRLLVFSGISTARFGSTVFARPQNPHTGNMDKMIVKMAYASDEGEISVLVKNDSSSQVTYAQDQWVLTYFATFSP